MKNKLLFLSLMVILMTSCASPKKFVYLQDMKVGEKEAFNFKHEAIVHRDDRLSITVTCKSPELALPFNNQQGFVSVAADGQVESRSVTKEVGYRVDIDGNIVFPILGKIQLEGLTVSQASELIRNKIIEGNYINDPQVSIEFLNFKYSVLGAANAGVYSVEGDRVTLLEALAKAGDTKMNARVDQVLVIREVGNERVVYSHDLRSKEFFNSPAFYLQQNDVIYVVPKYRRTDTESRILQYISVFVSIATAASAVLWYTTR
ncbi:MAG: polysaccharide biosynthesis/export family protein [Rikenellaceae bacterium]|nr:polysaccharide biosynthesis/export family protein [Rikenellaceae bacterium]